MVLDGNELDRVIRDAVLALRPGGALTRKQIGEIALSHIEGHIVEYIMPSIERLVMKEEIVEDRDCSKGRPYTYTAPRPVIFTRRL